MRLHVFVHYRGEGEARMHEKGVEIEPEHTNEGIIELFTGVLKGNDKFVKLELLKSVCTVLRLTKEEDGSVTVEIDLLDWARKGGG